MKTKNLCKKEEIDSIEKCRKKLFSKQKVRTDELEEAMVYLAHEGSDEAVSLLKEYGKNVPENLKYFYDCAYDEAAYFNFVEKTQDMKIKVETPKNFKPEENGEKLEQLERDCRSIEERLAEKGIIVSLCEKLPVELRKKYVEKLDELLKGFRFKSDGFIHFDGCSGYCEECFQFQWCDVAAEIMGSSRLM